MSVRRFNPVPSGRIVQRSKSCIFVPFIFGEAVKDNLISLWRPRRQRTSHSVVRVRTFPVFTSTMRNPPAEPSDAPKTIRDLACRPATKLGKLPHFLQAAGQHFLARTIRLDHHDSGWIVGAAGAEKRSGAESGIH